MSVSVRRNLRNYPPPLSRQRGHSPNGKVSVDLDLDIIFALTSYPHKCRAAEMLDVIWLK